MDDPPGSDEATAEVARHFRPARLVMPFERMFFAKERVKRIGLSRDVDCTFERLSNWANEQRVPQGTVYFIDDVRLVRGPQGTSLGGKLALTGFVDIETTWNGRASTKSANLQFFCWGSTAGVVPTYENIRTALTSGGGGAGWRLDFKPSDPS